VSQEEEIMSTNKQKALAKKILQNPSMEMGEAMKEIGFSENTRPHDVANTKSWQELMEKYLPDDLVLDTHKAGLTAMKQLSVRGGKDANAGSDDFIEVEDHPTRLKAVELAYKVKRKTEGTIAVQINNIIPILGGQSVKQDVPSNDSDK
jgi:hypothetical protein